MGSLSIRTGARSRRDRLRPCRACQVRRAWFREGVRRAARRVAPSGRRRLRHWRRDAARVVMPRVRPSAARTARAPGRPLARPPAGAPAPRRRRRRGDGAHGRGRRRLRPPGGWASAGAAAGAARGPMRPGCRQAARCGARGGEAAWRAPRSGGGVRLVHAHPGDGRDDEDRDDGDEDRAAHHQLAAGVLGLVLVVDLGSLSKKLRVAVREASGARLEHDRASRAPGGRAIARISAGRFSSVVSGRSGRCRL